MVVKTFRGLLADGGQERIELSTIRGKVGYRIVKFQAVGPDPSENIDCFLKIYKTLQSTIDANVDFTDSDLLASLLMTQSDSHYRTEYNTVIFDVEVFNQDIYITLKGVNYAANVNYYLELEVIPLDDAGAQYITLKDLRAA